MTKEKFALQMKDLVGTTQVVGGIVDSLIMKDQTKGIEEDVLLVRLKGGYMRVERSKMGRQSSKGSLAHYVGKKIFLQIDRVEEETSDVYGTHELVEEKRIENFKRKYEGETVEAKIIRFINGGALLEFEGMIGILYDNEFSQDFVSVNQVHKLGDTIEVVVKSTERGVSYTASTPYVLGDGEGVRAYSRGDIATGRISGVQTWGMFVNIAPGVDVLCSIPMEEDVEEGMEAVVRLTVVEPEERKVRGKVIRVQAPYVDEHLEVPDFLKNLEFSDSSSFDEDLDEELEEDFELVEILED